MTAAPAPASGAALPRLPAPAILTGIALVVSAVACFAVLDTTTKRVSASVPLLMALWMRYAFQAVATTAWFWPQRGRALWRTQRPGQQLLRGVLLMLTTLFAFLSLQHLPVGEFTALVMITPLAMTVLAAAVLGERVTGLHWALLGGGFAGVLVIVRPGSGTYGWAALLPLALVACNASFQVLTSRMSRTEDPATLHAYTGWVGTVIVGLTLPLVWEPVNDPWLWAGMLLMGLSGTLGHFLLILAYQRAPAATLAPYLYAQIPFAVLGGWWVFGHAPDALAWLGMAMIAVCGALGAWWNLRRKRAIGATGI